jgi:hypothetical protein
LDIFLMGHPGHDRMVVRFSTQMIFIKISKVQKNVRLGLWCLMPLSTIFSYIVVVSFTGGGNRSTRRKLPMNWPLNCHVGWSVGHFISKPTLSAVDLM